MIKKNILDTKHDKYAGVQNSELWAHIEFLQEKLDNYIRDFIRLDKIVITKNIQGQVWGHFDLVINESIIYKKLSFVTNKDWYLELDINRDHLMIAHPTQMEITRILTKIVKAQGFDLVQLAQKHQKSAAEIYGWMPNDENHFLFQGHWRPKPGNCPTCITGKKTNNQKVCDDCHSKKHKDMSRAG